MSQDPTVGTVAPGSPGATAPTLQLDEVTKRYGGVTAVAGISFRLEPGQRMAVIGPNGAGKTTLFKIIAGDVRPTTGRVHIFGEDVTTVPAFRRARTGLGRTFQVSNLLTELSVLDNVRVAAQANSSASRRFWSPQRADDDVTTRSLEVLAQVGLEARTSDTVADLSHGEQRQLEIAMALVGRPTLLLLDEPAAGLSAAERVVLRQLLEGLPRELSMLLIEHDMSLALELTDRVLCMDNGKPVILGTPQEIRADRTVREIYLGRSVA
jgi:branched-chain amino acid transport system ATP-binding protein